MLTVHLALVDDQSNEVPASTTISQLPDHAVVKVRPGDQEAATQVQGWLQAYGSSRDPRLREQIILAYLGLADRLASRFRDSRGTSPEDLRQTARVGLIAAIDRYDPDRGTPVRPLRRGLCGRRAQTAPAGHQLAAAGAPAAQGPGAADPPPKPSTALHGPLGGGR